MMSVLDVMMSMRHTRLGSSTSGLRKSLIAPISAAKDEEERPASRIAVIRTASSRKVATATSCTV